MELEHSGAEFYKRGQMRPFYSVALLSLLLCGCSTPSAPPPADDRGTAAVNPEVGYAGYRLRLFRYFPVAEDQVKDFPVLQTWLEDWSRYRNEARVREVPGWVVDDRFLFNGQRFIRFAVEETRAPTPFSRFAPDQRERVLRMVAVHWEGRAEVRGQELKLDFVRIGGKDALRSQTVKIGDSEWVYYAVMGRLNEIYHFQGLAEAGQARTLRSEIEEMIAGLTF